MPMACGQLLTAKKQIWANAATGIVDKIRRSTGVPSNRRSNDLEGVVSLYTHDLHKTPNLLSTHVCPPARGWVSRDGEREWTAL